jgi:predicted  nucleic acid-binding Zn-ribbon protein
MVADVKLLIQLQDIDKHVDELHKEISALPKHIAEIEKALVSHVRKLEADRAALVANQKDRKKIEGEIPVHEQKISKLKTQMLEAKTNEQYWAFQHEIEYCEKEIRRAEDRILDFMGQSEPLEQNVKAAEKALEEEKKQVEAEKQQTRERAAADQKRLADLKAERQRLISQISPQFYSAYERIRKKRRGIGVAEATDGLCSACHLALRPQFFQDLRRGEEVMFCESCGRILYYNPPPVSFDGVGPEQTSETPPVSTGK